MQRRWGLLIVAAVCLQGCVTAATSGAQAVYNHHSIEKSMNDQYLTWRAHRALEIDSYHFKNANINIDTLNRVILLSGQVPEQWQKSEASELVQKIAGVEEVYNWVEVAPPATQWMKIQDAWITTKVKAKLIASDEVDAATIKVVTENGTVFLMGVLPSKEADIAARLASTTAGIKQVVKIFSYITISKTAGV